MSNYRLLALVGVALASVLTFSSAQVTVPDLKSLANDSSDRNYTNPLLTCHKNFTVTILAYNWGLIAVEKFQYDNGRYGEGSPPANVSGCVSSEPYGNLHFNLQSHCKPEIHEANNTYKWVLRARAEYMIETSQDRQFDLSCTYTLSGDAIFETVTVSVNQEFTVAATVAASQDITITGSRIYLVDVDGTKVASPQVGQKVRFCVDSTTSNKHDQVPYIDVLQCDFYDRDPSLKITSSQQFSMTDQDGCNKQPSFYNAYTAAGTPRANGIVQNIAPVESSSTNFYTDGYLSGNDSAGIGCSDFFKVFKFPGTFQLWIKCSLNFCVEKSDPRCKTRVCPLNFAKAPTGSTYDHNLIRKRRAAEEEEKHFHEDVITLITVTSGGITTKIVNGPADLLTTETETEVESTECETRFYAVLGVTICLGVILIVIAIVYLYKRAHQKIRPFEKAMLIEGAYAHHPPILTTGAGMYGGGFPSGAVYGGGAPSRSRSGGGGGAGLTMITK